MLISSLPGYSVRLSGRLAHVPLDQTSEADKVLAALGAAASLFSVLLSLALSYLLFRHRFDKPLPIALSIYLLIYGVVMAGPLESWAFYWLDSADFIVALQGILLGIPTFALFALFPDGRFRPTWMRWVFLLSIPWGFSFLFVPTLNDENFTRYPLLFGGMAAGFILTMMLGIYAQVYRYRNVSTPEQRQQTKWAIFGFSLWIAYMLISSVPYFYLTGLGPDEQVPWWTGLSELGWWLSLNIIPITLTIATLRFRLWNVDQVINRTLVYTALTASVVALYALLVGGLGLLFRSSGRPWMPLLATGLAAVLFQPMRTRMQGFVNRMMYGERDDPSAVLAKLGDRLEKTLAPENTLTAIVQTIAQTLKLPYAAIEWGESGETVTSYGLPQENVDDFPLRYQGELVGRLRVAPRARGEPLSEKDHQLLENVARQASAVVYNARLTSDLLRAREHLVSSREEERRRIRRDLHDGLGPELASLTLKLDAARNLLSSDPAAAEELLDELKSQSQDAISSIRGLVHNLRPPALDELGLIGSLNSYAASRPSGSKPELHIQGPDPLPQLPAAIEVAAYRISLEALNNAHRHSGADHCWVTFKLDDGLLLEIRDDGKGLAESYQPGIGFSSMRERTEELGAELEIDSRPGTGTTIRAFFPFDAQGAA
jgi:signal transduction histidine kinase